jgi:hypothetical protein
LRQKTNIVKQDDQDVGRALGWAQRFDGRKLCFRILGVVGGQTDVLPVRDRKNITIWVFRSVLACPVSIRFESCD